MTINSGPKINSKKSQTVFHAVCFFAILNLLGYLFFSDEQKISTAETRAIGTVLGHTNDIRIKQVLDSNWSVSIPHQQITPGDLIYSGQKSGAEVKLKLGHRLTFGEDSVVQFGDTLDPNLLNFGYGNFRLTIFEHVKIALRGQIYEFWGTGTSIQIFDEPDKELQIKVLSGQLSFNSLSGSKLLTLNTGEAIRPERSSDIEHKQMMAEFKAFEQSTKNSESIDQGQVALNDSDNKSDALKLQHQTRPRQAEVAKLPSQKINSLKQNSRLTKIAKTKTVAKFKKSKNARSTASVTKEFNQLTELQDEELPSQDLNPQPISLGQVAAPDKPSIQEVRPLPLLAQYRTPLEKDFWVWLGAGVNFSSNSQTVPGFSDIQFGAINGPTAMLKTGFFASEYLGLELGYIAQPGAAKSGPAIKVAGGNYVWQTMMADLLIRTRRDLKRQKEFRFRLGLQQHQTPFLIPESASQIKVIDNSSTQAAVGFDYRRLYHEKLRLEWTMRYKTPLQSGKGSIKLQSELSFDGSIGAAYQVQDSLHLGAYWYGQYHQYNFDYDDGVGTQFSGAQRLFFSNIDFRMGWEF